MEKNGRKTTLVLEPTDRWSAQDAAELYDVASWGKGYFSVAATGHVCVHPDKNPDRHIDLKELVDNLQLRGIALPILIRFAEILKHRLGELHDAFEVAIREHKYNGNYCCVYPIKVNQQRQVVEALGEVDLAAVGLHVLEGGRRCGVYRDNAALDRCERRGGLVLDAKHGSNGV